MNVNLSVCTVDKTFSLFNIKRYVQNVQSSFHKIIQSKPSCSTCFIINVVKFKVQSLLHLSIVCQQYISFFEVLQMTALLQV